jgi:hypothetical protein
MLRQSKDLLHLATAANNGEIWRGQRPLVEEKIWAVRYLVLSTCEGWLSDGALMTAQCTQRRNWSGVAPVAA